MFTQPRTMALELEITQIKNLRGLIRMCVYDSPEGYRNDVFIWDQTLKKDSVKENRLSIKLYLPEGIYGIAVLDDENRDGKMNYFLGIPKEGFGFSGYFHSGLRKPEFSSFQFVHKNDNTKVTVKLKYL